MLDDNSNPDFALKVHTAHIRSINNTVSDENRDNAN